MIKVENYPNAYKEVYVILQNIDEKDYDLVPENFIKMVEHNMNKDYDFKLDENKDFEQQDLLQETKTILAYLYLNYWGTEEERIKIKEKFKQDIAVAEEKKRQKYNPDELFEKTSYTPQKPKVQIVEYKKESFFTKLAKNIKKFFGKN